MINKRKILFVNDEMRMGGVARVLNTLMDALPKDQFEIDLLVLHMNGLMMDEIPEGVNVIEGTSFFTPVDESLPLLWKERNFKEVCKKLHLLFYMKTGLITKKIRKERKKMLTKQYDVEVAAKEGFCTIFTAYGDSKKKINWVLTDYSVCNYSSNHMTLVKHALKHIDLNVADSKQAMLAYNEVFGVTNSITIHNLMDIKRIETCLKTGKSDLTTKGPNLITVARFHPQKAIMRMLIASNEAYTKGYKHTLYLVGGGIEEEMLRDYVAKEHMEHVVFLGYSKNPYVDIQECDLFVLSSLYEGFATVISESLIVGTPVLTTNVSGCCEQVVNPEDGWIVENSQKGFNEGLMNALSDLDRLQKMKEKLQTYHYPNEKILKEFIDVL